MGRAKVSERHQETIDIGANIKQARTAAGMSRKQLAEIICLTEGSLANIESGSQMCNLFKLLRICEATGHSPNNILQVKGR